MGRRRWLHRRRRVRPSLRWRRDRAARPQTAAARVRALPLAQRARARVRAPDPPPARRQRSLPADKAPAAQEALLRVQALRVELEPPVAPARQAAPEQSVVPGQAEPPDQPAAAPHDPKFYRLAAPLAGRIKRPSYIVQ